MKTFKDEILKHVYGSYYSSKPVILVELAVSNGVYMVHCCFPLPAVCLQMYTEC